MTWRPSKFDSLSTRFSPDDRRTGPDRRPGKHRAAAQRGAQPLLPAHVHPESRPRSRQDRSHPQKRGAADAHPEVRGGPAEANRGSGRLSWRRSAPASSFGGGRLLTRSGATARDPTGSSRIGLPGTSRRQPATAHRELQCRSDALEKPNVALNWRARGTSTRPRLTYERSEPCTRPC